MINEKVDVPRDPVPQGRPAVDPRPLELRGLAATDRRALGDELSGLVAAGNSLRDDPAAIRRLDDILEHLAASRSQAREPIRFHVPDSMEVNAFSHIGGHVYINRGVFALAQTDAELEFVVAHELAHTELGHPAAGVEQLARQAGAGMGLIPGLYLLIALGYSAEQEFEADAWAYRALRHAGRSHREAIGFLRRYSSYAASHNLLGHHPSRTRPGDSRPDVENHYPAHPPAGERIKRVAALAGPASAGRAPAGSPQ